MEWMHKSLTRAGLGILLAASMTLAGCGEGDDVKVVETADSLVAKAKADIGNKQYSKALIKCRKAVELDKENVEAHYCIVAGNVGAMVQSLSSIISLIANLNLAPSVSLAAIDGKNLLGSFLSEIEDQMAEIDRHAYVLVGKEDPKYSIDKFPLALDPADLLKLLSIELESNTGDELVIDLKGTWDSTQLHMLGGGLNAVQAILDYLFAHNLTIDNYNDLSFDSSEGIADVFFKNPKIGKLDTDEDSVARLSGEGKWKGAKLGFLAALSYMVGRDADLERVAPKNDGLREAIKLSAASKDTSRVILWTDADGDGIPEKVSVPAIGALGAKVTIDGETTEIESEIENSISVALWDKLIQLGKDIRDNIEDEGAAPYAVKPIVTSVFDEVAASDSTVTRIAELIAGKNASQAEIDAEKKSVLDFLATELPDLIYVNPGDFLADPAGLRNLLPYYFEYTTGSTKKVDLAWEIEIYGGGVTQALEKRGQVVDVSAADYAHFDYSEEGITYAFTHFPGVNVASLKIAADGITTSTSFSSAYYLRLQDSSFGGLLQLNLSAVGQGAAGVAKQEALGFNKGLNGLIKHYQEYYD